MRQTTWTPVYFIAQLFYFIALVRTASLRPPLGGRTRLVTFIYFIIILIGFCIIIYYCMSVKMNSLQCFDTVGWATGSL